MVFDFLSIIILGTYLVILSVLLLNWVFCLVYNNKYVYKSFFY